MSAFLKKIVCIGVIVAGFLTNNVFAQCNVTKTKKNNITTIQTGEQYEYLRSGKQYYGLSVKTVATQKANNMAYKVVIKYTGGILLDQPVNIILKLIDGYALAGRIKFVKDQKTDDKKTKTRIYEFVLSENDLNNLKQTPLQQIDIVFGKQRPPVTININDQTFMQLQVTCLQNS